MAGAGADTDRNPDDYKRVRVTLDWSTRGAGHCVTQTSAIINPVGGLGPSVTSLVPTTWRNVDPIQLTTVGAEQDRLPRDDLQLRRGRELERRRRAEGQAPSGVRLNWDFTWNLDKPDGTPLYHDCTYVVQADAFDAQDRAGTPRVADRGREPRARRSRRRASAAAATGRATRGPPVGPEPGVRRQGLPRVPQHRRRRARDAISVHRRDDATSPRTSSASTNPPRRPAQFYTVVALDTPTGSGARARERRARRSRGPQRRQRRADGATSASAIGASRPASTPADLPRRVGQVVVSWDPSTDPDGRSTSTGSTATARRSRTATTTSSRAPQPGYCLVRVRLGGRAAHLQRQRRRQHLRGVRAERTGDGRLER